MKIKIAHDYQGYLIPGHFYVTGTEIEVDEDTGGEMIRLGHAELVEAKPKTAQRKKSAPPAPRKPKAKVDDGS